MIISVDSKSRNFNWSEFLAPAGAKTGYCHYHMFCDTKQNPVRTWSMTIESVGRSSFEKWFTRIEPLDRAPDNFLKQGVANASLGAKGVFLQNPEVFSLPNFYTRAFLEFGN